MCGSSCGAAAPLKASVPIAATVGAHAPDMSGMPMPAAGGVTTIQHDGHTKHLFGRTTAEDPQAAQRMYDALVTNIMSRYPTLAEAQAAGYAPTSLAQQSLANGAKEIHISNPATKRDGRLADPAAPEMLVYKKSADGTWRIAGVVFTQYGTKPTDLPMGEWHNHSDASLSGQATFMQHIWFTGTLATAFSEDGRNFVRV